MKQLVLVFSCLALAACDQPKSAEPGAKEKLSNGDVAQIAVAPDGTTLWAVSVGGRYIYFASGSAQWKESCGKNCRREYTVPTK